MSLRRLSMAAALVCGLCVWGFARSGDEPPVRAEAVAEGDDNRAEAEAQYRASQPRHWRHMAIGNQTVAR